LLTNLCHNSDFSASYGRVVKLGIVIDLQKQAALVTIDSL